MIVFMPFSPPPPPSQTPSFSQRHAAAMNSSHSLLLSLLLILLFLLLLLLLQLQLSLLRVVHDMLGHVTTLQPLPLLPSLLTALRALSTVGLPGYQRGVASTPVLPHPHTGGWSMLSDKWTNRQTDRPCLSRSPVAVDPGWQAPSVAGPRRQRVRAGHGSRGVASCQEVSGNEEDGGERRKGKGRGRERRRDSRASQPSPVTSDSDSELSDGEGGVSPSIK